MKSNKLIEVQIIGFSAVGHKAFAIKEKTGDPIYVNIDQLEIPEEYKALEVLYG